jgi:hypothetical protein
VPTDGVLLVSVVSPDRLAGQVDGPEVGGGPPCLCDVNQTTARAALAALDGLRGVHAASVRQLDTGFTPSLQRMHR